MNSHYGAVKEKAYLLRKNGDSYGKISKNLGVAKSTLSYWFSDNEALVK